MLKMHVAFFCQNLIEHVSFDICGFLYKTINNLWYEHGKQSFNLIDNKQLFITIR